METPEVLKLLATAAEVIPLEVLIEKLENDLTNFKNNQTSHKFGDKLLFSLMVVTMALRKHQGADLGDLVKGIDKMEEAQAILSRMYGN